MCKRDNELSEYNGLKIKKASEDQYQKPLLEKAVTIVLLISGKNECLFL